MTTIIEAVFEGGFFRPVGKVDLEEGTHVEVRIRQPIGQRDPKAVAAKLAHLAAQTPIQGPRESTARDHDQILYGGGKRG